jgi:thymidylate synthase (FAD)
MTPSVPSMQLYLIASTAFRAGHETFLRSHSLHWSEQLNVSEAQRLIEFAGRICYMSFGERQSPRTNPQYVANLILQGHESVLEHATITILADGISRALSHQLVRHRVGFSYSQLSQQYHDETQAQFRMPADLESVPEALAIWQASVEASKQAYLAMLQKLEDSTFGQDLNSKERMRAIRSASRTILPNATATSLVMSGNVRAWRHLFDVRGSIAGDEEMREFCAKCFDILCAEVPAGFADFEVVNDETGKQVRKRPPTKEHTR